MIICLLFLIMAFLSSAAAAERSSFYLCSVPRFVALDEGSRRRLHRRR